MSGRLPGLVRFVRLGCLLTASLWGSLFLDLSLGRMSPRTSCAAEFILDDFETPETSWRAAGADCQVRPLQHKRISTEFHSGQGSEWIHIQAAPGTYVYYSHPISPARIIPELQLSVWIKSNRPGLQLLTRVVFPRNLDPHTQQPLTTWIRGSSYSQVGEWEQLVLRNVPTLVRRATQQLRAQLGPQVDEREAFLDMAVLNVYGGTGSTSVLIDDLVSVSQVDTSQLRAGLAAWTRKEPQESNLSTNFADETLTFDRGRIDTARLEGSVLVAGGRPLFPRLLEHHGESFELTKALGFDGIILPMVPTPQQLTSASEHGIWLVAPPPNTDRTQQIGPEFNCVLAWDLGHRLVGTDLDATRQLANAVRGADPVSARPVICNVRSEHRRFSRHANLLLVGRDTLHTSFDLREYGPWLAEQRGLAGPWTPVWAALQTDIAPALLQQWQSMGMSSSEEITVDPDQLKLLAYTLIASGARGLCFASHHPVSPHPEISGRAAALGLLNQDLELIAPWAAAGKTVASVATSDPQVHVTVLGLDRSHLVLPIRYVPHSQFAAGASNTQTISFVIPGVPDSSEPFLITSSRLKPLRRKRVAGGMRVTLNDFSLTSAIVMTQDPLVIRQLTRQLAEQRVRRSRFAHDIATHLSTTTESTILQLAGPGAKAPSVDATLNSARSTLAQCQQLFQSGDYKASTEYANQAILQLSQVRRATWEQASGRFRWPVASPLLMHFQTLPLHWEMTQRVAMAGEGDNLLAAGDFESLSHMIQNGWQQEITSVATVYGDIELSPQTKKSGNYSLHIRTLTRRPDKEDPLVAIAPVTVRSAAVTTQPGQLVKIQGWIMVDGEITRSRDGFVVSDSVGGTGMGLRVSTTDGWQPFVLYRTADASGELRAVFSMTGVGDVFIDDVAVHPIPYSPANDHTLHQAIHLRQMLPPPALR